MAHDFVVVEEEAELNTREGAAASDVSLHVLLRK